MPAIFQISAPRFTGLRLVTVGTDNVAPLTGLGNANHALITFEGSAVRYRLDGVTAHSATGHLATASQSLELVGGDLLSGLRVVCTNTTAWLTISVGGL